MVSLNLDNNLTSLEGRGDTPALPNDFIGPSYGNDVKTGISKFHLATMDGETPVVLTGLLTELPEMSFTVNYEDGPGNEWQDTIANFTGNSLMQIVNALGSANQGADWKNLVKVGTWTKKVYNGYSISNIPLKFRIYPSDTLGQSSFDTWFLNLRRFAAISEANKMDPGLLAKNALSAYTNVVTAGERAAVADGFVTKINKVINPNKNKSSEDMAAEAEENYIKDKERNERAIAIFNKAVSSAIGNKFKIVWRDGNGVSGILTNKFNGGRFDINRTIHLHYASDNSNDDQLAEATVGHIMDPDIDPKKYKGGNDRPFDLSNITSAFNQLEPKDFDNEEEDKKSWERAKAAVLNEIERLDTGESYNDHDTFAQNIKLIGELANSVGEFLVEKFNEYRVVNQFNKDNALGEKLWYLHLYENVIFNKDNPLIVYISDWSCQRSEEYDMNINQPVYYEFTINCVLDQVYSRGIWQKKLFKLE